MPISLGRENTRLTARRPFGRPPFALARCQRERRRSPAHRSGPRRQVSGLPYRRLSPLRMGLGDLSAIPFCGSKRALNARRLGRVNFAHALPPNSKLQQALLLRTGRGRSRPPTIPSPKPPERIGRLGARADLKRNRRLLQSDVQTQVFSDVSAEMCNRATAIGHYSDEFF